MNLAITPRFFENKVERLISIERKYYPFFQKYGHNLNLIHYTGIEPGDFLMS